jgi:hypothetical protein
MPVKHRTKRSLLNPFPADPGGRGVKDYCVQCGADVPNGAKLCAGCGRAFGTPLPGSTNAATAVAVDPLAWRRGIFRRLWWLFLLGAAVLIIATAVENGTAGASATPVPVVVSKTTVAAGSMTATGLRLGDTEAAFIATLGQPGPDTARGVDDHFLRCASGADQYMVAFTGGRASEVLRQYCGAIPSASQRMAEARAFFPSDAPASGTAYTNENGDPAWTFRSSSLAQLFTLDAFQTCSDGTPAGSFELDLAKSSWQIGIGHCP